MSIGYTAKNVVKNGESVEVGASQTNFVVSGEGAQDSFNIQIPFLTSFRLDLVCSAVTVTTAITAKLQTRFSSQESWVDSKTASITGNGVATISLLDTVAGDQSFLPLRPLARVVITTGASDAVTVDAIWVPRTT